MCLWSSFATSGGKNACHGIGDNVKRAVAITSSKRPAYNQFLTARSMFSLLRQLNFSEKIKFFLSSEYVAGIESELPERYTEAKTKKDTQKLHRLAPQCDPIVAPKIYELSSIDGDIVCGKKNVEGEELKDYARDKYLIVGMFGVCLYILRFAMMMEVSEKSNTVLIAFMHPKGRS